PSRYLLSVGALSDDQGNFRISSLTPGRYYLSAEDGRSGEMNDRSGRASTTPPESNVTTYFPDAPDLTSAVPIDVSAGSELTGYNIRLRKARTYSLRGKAMDASGAPLPNLVIEAVPQHPANIIDLSSHQRWFRQTETNGSFEIRGLTSGTYLLQAMSSFNMNEVEDVRMGRLEVALGNAKVDGIVLPLVPGFEIAGSLRL